MNMAVRVEATAVSSQCSINGVVAGSVGTSEACEDRARTRSGIGGKSRAATGILRLGLTFQPNLRIFNGVGHHA